MNRNNVLIHIALAVVLILVAAFAGQLRRWQKEYKTRIRIMPAEEKTRSAATTADVATIEAHALARPEVLVRFKPGIGVGTIQDITEKFNDRVEDSIESVSGLYAIDDLDDANAVQTVASYLALPEVEYAEPNYDIEADDFEFNPIRPSDPRFSDQWALANDGQRGGKQGADISAMIAWSVTTGDDDVVIAVLDSGVDYNHPDLENNMWKRPANVPEYVDDTAGTVQDLQGYNAINNDADPMDENGHGTHCAGIIGAEGGNDIGITGVNWKVRIMPLKFMNKSGWGTTKDAIEAINYVIDRKNHGVNVRVISASWGSTNTSKALEDVIDKAYEAGILFVAAAGNASTDNDRRPHYPSSYKNVVAVAAMDRNDQLASFSNWGAKHVAIAAPGAEILSTWLNDEYEEKSGTSMATPVVAGVAALVAGNEPRLSVDDLRKRLLTSVDKVDALKSKVSSGGRINAAKALGAK